MNTSKKKDLRARHVWLFSGAKLTTTVTVSVDLAA